MDTFNPRILTRLAQVHQRGLCRMILDTVQVLALALTLTVGVAMDTTAALL
jgi:hypothetical protein